LPHPPIQEEHVRKRFLLGALIGALCLALGGFAIASPTLQQTADIKLTTKRAAKSSGVNADLQSSDPAGQPPGNQPATTKVVIQLPPGSRVDSSAHPQCNLTGDQVAANQCPANTKVGSGTATANGYAPGPPPTVIQNVTTSVTAYNRRAGLAFLVRSTDPRAPGTAIPIIAQLTKKGKLTANIPVLPLLGPGSRVFLTTFKVRLSPKSKLVRRRGKRVRKNLLTSPKVCRGTWTTTARFTYEDGDTRTVRTTQSCRRTPRR
jgi:hypothetical protein